MARQSTMPARQIMAEPPTGAEAESRVAEPGSRAVSAGWLNRNVGPLEVRFRPHSFAAQEIDDLTERLAEALARVTQALELSPTALDPVVICVGDECPEDLGRPADLSPGSTIALVHTPEVPCSAPERELTHLLLRRELGPPPPSARFWDVGLAEYLAGPRAHATGIDDVSGRCRQLAADGLLPPLDELVAEAGSHVSSLARSAAGSFAEYLIDRYGMVRYLRLIRAARRRQPDAFSHVYHTSLAVADRDWRRRLEATGRAREPSSWMTIRRILPLACPYWPQALQILVYVLIGVTFSLALPLAFRFLIDNVLARRPLQEPIPFIGPVGHVIAAGQEQMGALASLMASLGVLYVLNAGARLQVATLTNATSEAFVLALRRRMLDVVGHLPSAFFARTTVADLNQRVLQDTAVIQQVLAGALIPAVTGVLSIALYTTVLITLEWRLAVVAMLGLPLLALTYRLRRRGLRAAARERVRRLSALSAGVNEFVAVQALSKVYRASPFLLGRLDRRLESHAQLNVAYSRESSALGQTGTLIMHLSQVAVLLAGGYLVVVSDGRDLAPGGLAAFYVLLNQLFGPVAQVASARQNLVGASASLERVSELLAQSPETDRPDAVDVDALREAIRFAEVGFAYDTGRPVLRQLSLTIPAGSTVAFVGSTGAGKSSVVQLLPRLYQPTHGTITWDGLDIRSARLDALRRQVVLVPQEPFLLNTTLYENIRFGLEGVSDEDVHRAARQAHVHDFITALPDGYDTVVGERGAGLSGGQRQRIALARALVREPSVLILDEATSALDATTQRTVHEALRASAPGRTIIKIAHRLETVADADVIFVLEDGRLVEQGCHADLLARNGVYTRLYEDQVGPLDAATRPSPRQAARWLLRLAPFASLPPELHADLAAILVRTEVTAGETIYQQGAASGTVYVIGRGRVSVLDVDDDGNERTINILGTGTTIGVSEFLSGRPRATTVRAATDLVLFSLGRSAYQALVERSAVPHQTTTTVGVAPASAGS